MLVTFSKPVCSSVWTGIMVSASQVILRIKGNHVLPTALSATPGRAPGSFTGARGHAALHA